MTNFNTVIQAASALQSMEIAYRKMDAYRHPVIFSVFSAIPARGQIPDFDMAGWRMELKYGYHTANVMHYLFRYIHFHHGEYLETDASYVKSRIWST